MKNICIKVHGETIKKTKH